jgi:hypothetical protein
MNKIETFNFEGIYSFIDLIEGNVNANVSFWNYDEQYFIEHSSRFSKETLLHHYIVISCFNYYSRDFKKYPESYEGEDGLEFWYSKFEKYNIDYSEYCEETNKDLHQWYIKYQDDFLLLFEYLSNEIFYILFHNRNFLLAFNNIVSDTVEDLINLYPEQLKTPKPRIKRKNIPAWVKNAVFHRDKGRCVFCNTDLTNLINTLTNKNYDHIVPLDLYGVNDPCNIQLSCEKCNKSKSNKEPETTNSYFSWW